MGWIEHLINRESITGLYDSIEGLERLDVIELKLFRDGPVLQLRADLARFPDRPSKRWEPGANRVQVQLDFLGVEALQLHDFSVLNQGVLTVEHEGARYRFTFSGTSLSIEGSCAALRIAGISAYQDGRETAERSSEVGGLSLIKARGDE